MSAEVHYQALYDVYWTDWSFHSVKLYASILELWMCKEPIGNTVWVSSERHYRCECSGVKQLSI